MKLIPFFILISFSLSAQKVADLKLDNNNNYRKGRVIEFVSYPLFTISGALAGMSNKFGKIDSPESHRSQGYALAASGGFVTSTGLWGVGISLQEKPTWKDLYKLVGVAGFSAIGYGIGYYTADVFPSK